MNSRLKEALQQRFDAETVVPHAPDAIERADQMLRTLDPPAPQGRLGLPSARGRGNERAEFAQSIGKCGS